MTTGAPPTGYARARLRGPGQGSLSTPAGASVGVARPELAIARVISDVWLSNLVAWLTRRSSATDVARRLELTVDLLLGDGPRQASPAPV